MAAETWLEALQNRIIAQAFEGLTSTASVVIGPPEDGDDVPDFMLGLVDRPGPTDETYGAMSLRPNLTLVMRSEPMKAGPAYTRLEQVYLWLTSGACADVEWEGHGFVRFEPMLAPGRLRLDHKRRTDLTAEVAVWRAYVDQPQ